MNNNFTKFNRHFIALKNNKLFNSLPDLAIEELLSVAQYKTWRKKTCYLDTTNTSSTFYIIISGCLKSYGINRKNNRELTLYLLSSNDVFNISMLVNGIQNNLYYEVMEESEILYIPIENMRSWMIKYPDFYKPLLSYHVEKLLTLENSLIDISLEDTPIRLAKLLLSYNNSDSNKIEFIENFSHNDLANLLGTTRPVLNRHLQDLKNAGIINITRKHIELINLDLLLKRLNNHIKN